MSLALFGEHDVDGDSELDVDRDSELDVETVN
jgi:hypothetical protein